MNLPVWSPACSSTVPSPSATTAWIHTFHPVSEKVTKQGVFVDRSLIENAYYCGIFPPAPGEDSLSRCPHRSPQLTKRHRRRQAVTKSLDRRGRERGEEVWHHTSQNPTCVNSGTIPEGTYVCARISSMKSPRFSAGTSRPRREPISLDACIVCTSGACEGKDGVGAF